MKAIEFYKYIVDNNIEFNWHENPDTKERDVVIFLYFWQIGDFAKLLSPHDYDDEGIKCVMKDGYLAFWANPILEPHEIELVDIFGTDPEKL